MVCVVLVAALAYAGTGAAVADVVLPGGRELERVDFERHVMGLFSRAGCNSASCHGSFKGKGGFRLSLFGFEPEKDFRAVTRDASGKRIDRENADESLLLRKPTGEDRHGGGVRFAKDSWEYHVLREWLRRGALRNEGAGEVAELMVSPPEVVCEPADGVRTIRVSARFADGSQEDITAFCEFRTNDDAVAEVSHLGVVKSIRPGSTAIIVSYRGCVRPVPVLVPVRLPPGFSYPQVPERNFVDREVFARLRLLNMVPSDGCVDGEFLRRLSIDTIGRLPTPAEVRSFLADKDPEKRAKKIDELLNTTTLAFGPPTPNDS